MKWPKQICVVNAPGVRWQVVGMLDALLWEPSQRAFYTLVPLSKPRARKRKAKRK